MVDILAIGSHPDDIEFGCGGILAKEAALGRSIALVDLTFGEKGTHGNRELRQQEALQAASLIGATRTFLNFNDCEVVDTYEGRLQLIRLIRDLKPRLVLAPMWKGEQNHPDHLATGQMARAACRFARFAKILPDIPIHAPEGILHYPPYSFVDRSDFIFDITPHVETWKKMILAHASQLQTIDYHHINMAAASHLGALIGVPFAQGLIKGNPIVIDSLMSVSQGAREI